VVRFEAGTGPLEIRYQAVVDSDLPSLPAEVGPDCLGRLPLAVLTYLLPSRYYESDRFTQTAYGRFWAHTNRAALFAHHRGKTLSCCKAEWNCQHAGNDLSQGDFG
jgi:hypothetical protein